jgi:hypothetical protein
MIGVILATEICLTEENPPVRSAADAQQDRRGAVAGRTTG